MYIISLATTTVTMRGSVSNPMDDKSMSLLHGFDNGTSKSASNALWIINDSQNHSSLIRPSLQEYWRYHLERLLYWQSTSRVQGVFYVPPLPPHNTTNITFERLKSCQTRLACSKVNLKYFMIMLGFSPIGLLGVRREFKIWPFLLSSWEFNQFNPKG